jgi:hypothetical protein
MTNEENKMNTPKAAQSEELTSNALLDAIKAKVNTVYGYEYLKDCPVRESR